MKTLKNSWTLLRPHHWVKNGVIFLPAFFAGELWTSWELLILGFISFSLVASSIYILNDIADLETDRDVEGKKNLFARGELSEQMGFILAVFLVSSSLSLAFFIDGWHWILLYFVWNLLYSFYFKTVPWLEMLFIVAGFLIRLQFGSAITEIPITFWLYLEIILVMSAIILSKRIRELHDFLDKQIMRRSVLKIYSITSLKFTFLIVLVALSIVYGLYCFSPEVIGRMGENTWITIPFAVLGLWRFVYTTFRQIGTVNPVNNLFVDPWFGLITAVWLISWGFVIYG